MVACQFLTISSASFLEIVDGKKELFALRDHCVSRGLSPDKILYTKDAIEFFLSTVAPGLPPEYRREFLDSISISISRMNMEKAQEGGLVVSGYELTKTFPTHHPKVVIAGVFADFYGGNPRRVIDIAFFRKGGVRKKIEPLSPLFLERLGE